MDGLRRCKGTIYEVLDGKCKPVEFALGYFHGWGCNYQEFEEGPGNFSVAIVELPDGRVVTPQPDDIVFIDTIK